MTTNFKFPCHPLTKTHTLEDGTETVCVWGAASVLVNAIISGSIDKSAGLELVNQIKLRASDPLCFVLMFNDEAYYRMAVTIIAQCLTEKSDIAFGVPI